MTKLYDLNYIEKELRTVDADLSRRITMYAIPSKSADRR